MEDNLKWETTTNIKSKISKQQLVGSFPNFKLMGLKQILQMFQMKTTCTGRRHQMEDYLKYQKWNISATTNRIFPKFWTFFLDCFETIPLLRGFEQNYVGEILTFGRLTKQNFTNVSTEDNLQKWKISAATGWFIFNFKTDAKVTKPNITNVVSEEYRQ